jgi:CubicO group peptidase (beta-lactamase class C family)
MDTSKRDNSLNIIILNDLNRNCMIKILICILLTFIALGSISQSPTLTAKTSPLLTTVSNPQLAGISSSRLNRLDQALQKLIKDEKLPGLVALVARKGKIVYQKAYGYADFETKKPQRTDDIFRIASMTKAITATAIMMLYEEGKFSLDDPISKWIPGFAHPGILDSFIQKDSSFTVKPTKKEITIRNLLNHTSGIGYGLIDGDERMKKIYAKAGIKEIATTDHITTAENISRLAKLPLHFEPGEKWSYSMGLDVLGYFIEIISGESFSDYLANHLFKPLGMKDTYFYLPESKFSRLVKVHRPDSLKKWNTSSDNQAFSPDYPITGTKSLCSGGGGLSSTAKDYAIFLQMLLNNGVYGRNRFLSRPTVNLLTVSNQVGDLWGGEKGQSHFSLAFSVINKAGVYLGNGSEDRFTWGGYFNTNYWADPKEQIIVVLMKQTLGLNDNSEGIFTRMVYQAIDD